MLLPSGLVLRAMFMSGMSVRFAGRFHRLFVMIGMLVRGSGNDVLHFLPAMPHGDRRQPAQWQGQQQYQHDQ